MAELKFSVQGEVQLSRNLRVFAKNIANLKPFFEDALDIVENKSNQIWATAGSNVEKNPKWKGLAPSTQKARERRWGYYKKAPSSPKVLRWTGKLQDDKTKEVTKSRGVLAYNAPYAVYHQEGGGRLPRRAIIDLDNGTNTLLVKALQKKINDEIGIFGNQA